MQAQYNLLLKNCLDGIKEANQRTGVNILVPLNPACSLSLDLSDGLLPLPANRKYYPHAAAAELAWSLMGTQDATWINTKTSMWQKFTDANGEIYTAYGHRWQKHFGRNQLKMAIKALKADPSNRQVVVMAWDAVIDGLDDPARPDNPPCPIGFQLTISNGRLNVTVWLRSSDVWVGLPYDTMMYALLLDALSKTLKCMRGTLTMQISHLHLYEKYEAEAEQSLENQVFPVVDLPGWPLAEVIIRPNGYVEHLYKAAKSTTWAKSLPIEIII